MASALKSFGLASARHKCKARTGREGKVFWGNRDGGKVREGRTGGEARVRHKERGEEERRGRGREGRGGRDRTLPHLDPYPKTAAFDPAKEMHFLGLIDEPCS
jgi:hypothetical protein